MGPLIHTRWVPLVHNSKFCDVLGANHVEALT